MREPKTCTQCGGETRDYFFSKDILCGRCTKLKLILKAQAKLAYIKVLITSGEAESKLKPYSTWAKHRKVEIKFSDSRDERANNLGTDFHLAIVEKGNPTNYPLQMVIVGKDDNGWWYRTGILSRNNHKGCAVNTIHIFNHYHGIGGETLYLRRDEAFTAGLVHALKPYV